MPIECRQATTGGKGNKGLFIERDPKIVAAGIPSAQCNENVGDALKHYLLKEEVDALISDAIIPEPEKRPLPPLRKPIPLDKRHAGSCGDVAQIINPPNKTKFETLVNDIKETSYKSYWTLPLGKTKDPVPMLPEGFDIVGTTFGKPTAFHGRLYDIVMPKVPNPDKTPDSKGPGVQTTRNYCAPPYNPDLTYGHRTFLDKRGTHGRCCVTDDRITLGSDRKTIMNPVQANFLEAKQPRLGIALAPNNNISCVPEGYSFGILKPPDNLPECLSYCELNTGVDFCRKCLKHLNTVRKALTTKLLPTFFNKFYLTLKYYDPERTGWLPKDIVYKQCGIKFIRFDPALIEPLLKIWQAFDGSKIKYKTFIRVINYRDPLPDIPKILDVKPECLDYRTTYSVMTRPGQKEDNPVMAGVPSGRYFDLDFPISPAKCCKADRTCLPHESDMKSCIAPSILTQMFVNHRDMYAKREPGAVRKLFESIGEKFTDEKFNELWAEAQKLHSQGWVCYETFRRVLDNPHDEKSGKQEHKN